MTTSARCCRQLSRGYDLMTTVFFLLFLFSWRKARWRKKVPEARVLFWHSALFPLRGMSRAFLFWFAFSMGPDTGARSGFPNISSNKSSTTARPESRRVLDHSPPRPFFSLSRAGKPRVRASSFLRLVLSSALQENNKRYQGFRHTVQASCLEPLRRRSHTLCSVQRHLGNRAGHPIPTPSHLSLSLGTRVVVSFFPSWSSSLFVFDCVSKISPWSKRIAAMQITSTGPARTGTEAFSCLDTSARFFVYSPGSPSS